MSRYHRVEGQPTFSTVVLLLLVCGKVESSQHIRLSTALTEISAVRVEGLTRQQAGGGGDQTAVEVGFLCVLLCDVISCCLPVCSFLRCLPALPVPPSWPPQSDTPPPPLPPPPPPPPAPPAPPGGGWRAGCSAAATPLDWADQWPLHWRKPHLRLCCFHVT